MLLLEEAGRTGPRAERMLERSAVVVGRIGSAEAIDVDGADADAAGGDVGRYVGIAPFCRTSTASSRSFSLLPPRFVAAEAGMQCSSSSSMNSGKVCSFRNGSR